MLSRCVNPIVSRRCRLVIVLAALLAGITVSAGSTAIAGTQVPFPQPDYLQPRVEFWVRIFSQYSSHDFVIHDSDDVWRIYQVFHVAGSRRPSAREIADVDNYLKHKYGSILDRLATGKKPSTAAERRVAALFHHPTPATYREAAANLRVQQGLSDQFSRGMRRSLRYRRTMERIFNEAGLPKGLIFLAAVESEFNPRARSHANAVGIWQFIASTGRKYLHISRHRDDRLNPVRATRAAAKLLRANYEQFHSWPLAITAYNYGSRGTARAAAASDGSYRHILKHWDGPRFGFAVKNYYSEFLAALHIYRNAERYFPDLGARVLVARDDEYTYGASHYRVRSGDTLSGIARRFGVSTARLARANGVRNARALRAGRRLVIPGSHYHHRYAHVERTRYRVRRGDTLYSIAHRFGVGTASLRRANGVRNARALRPGRRLVIPRGHYHRYAHVERTHYRVRRGDTLYSIAQHSGVRVKDLMEANNVDDPHSLAVGTVLVIPGA